MSEQMIPPPNVGRVAEASAAGDVAELDLLFRGFADPTRLRLLNALVPGPLRVNDLVELLGLPQPLVSRHLAYLRRVSLVACDRGPRSAEYRLATPVGPVHERLIDCVRACFGGIASLGAERAAAAALGVGATSRS